MTAGAKSKRHYAWWSDQDRDELKRLAEASAFDMDVFLRCVQDSCLRHRTEASLMAQLIRVPGDNHLPFRRLGYKLMDRRRLMKASKQMSLPIQEPVQTKSFFAWASEGVARGYLSETDAERLFAKRVAR